MPRSEKADTIEYERRIRIVQEWILEDWSSSDIQAQITHKWGIEERQAKRYISEARKRWIAEEDLVTAHKKKLKIESLKKLKRSLQDRYKGTPIGIDAILKVEKEIIALEGLKPARRLEVMGKGGQPIKTESTHTSNVDYAMLPDEVLLAIVGARKKTDV
jgi:hypothetical protein